MKVYYRDGNDAFHGDLTYITDFSEFSSLTFDANVPGLRRKRISLEDPQIVAIGVSRIHVRDQHGEDYVFYTEQPEWIQIVPRIAEWCLRNERGTNVVNLPLTSDQKEV